MKANTKNVVFTALMVAIIAVCAQIAIPSPFGVPFTLQTLSIAFCGYFLGVVYSLTAVGVYLFCGIIGLPFFSGFSGGIGSFTNGLGGFLIGFIPLVVLCGLRSKTDKNWLAFLLGIIGAIVCHLIGTLGYSLAHKTPYFVSMLSCSLPFILKDLGSVILAKVLADKLKIILQNKNR